MPLEHDAERLAGNVLHNHPVVPLSVRAHVVQADQVRMLEIQALGHAAQLHLHVAATHQLQSDLLTAIAHGIIHLAEAAPADAALQRVSVQRSLSRIVDELHGSTPYILPVPVPTGSMAKAKSSPETVDVGRSNPRSRQ